MSSYAVIDETFDLNISSTYHLSIQAGLGGFSLCVLDTLRNKYIALKHINFNPPLRKDLFNNKIKAILYSERFLKKQYKRVYFSIISPESMLVPDQLFDKEKLAVFYSFSRDLNEGDEIYYNKLRNTSASNVFTLPSELGTILNNHFKGLNIYHHSTPFIENTLRINRIRMKEKKVYINIHRGFFDILVAGGDSILLYNSFLYRNSNDLIYFILYVYRQLDLSTETNGLMICGEIAGNSQDLLLIKKYIKIVRIEKFSEKFHYSYTFNKVPNQYFTNLLNLYTCGS